MITIEYLNEERVKLWKKLEDIETEIKNAQIKREEVTQQSSKIIEEKIKALEASLQSVEILAKNKSTENEMTAMAAAQIVIAKKDEILKHAGIVENAKKQCDAAQASFSTINVIEADIRKIKEDVLLDTESIVSSRNDAERKSKEIIEIQNRAQKTEAEASAKWATIAQQAENFEQKIQDIENNCNSYLNKVTALHSGVAENSQETKKLYDNIFGYEYKDDKTGEIKNIEGLKSKLEKTYDSLSINLGNLSKELTNFKEVKENEYIEFIQSKENEYSALSKKISELLPDALTAGLSHAYQRKRQDEEKERDTANKSFRTYIGLLTLSAFIPFVVSLYLAYGGQTLVEIIVNIPKIVMAILPIYIPLIWLAIVANKKINLSKRLIEEYSHKETLSKTFEGLSKQIDMLPNDSSSADLRIRLLYNLVNATAENPGTLILNYNKSDNPVFEVLDKSASLGKSFEKLAAIPGIARVLDKVIKQQNAKKKQMEEQIERGVASTEE